MDRQTLVTCFGPEGAGHYSDLHLLAHDIFKERQDTVLQAVAMSLVPNNGPFVICDFGTSDGGTSMSLITECVEMVKTKGGENQQLVIIYEDQKNNDFKSLMTRVQGASFSSRSGVFVSFSATDFYTQCLPDNSLDVGLCFSAVHWLSESPIARSKDIFSVRMTGENLQMFRQQASRDWETFLLARSRELKPGGQLVVGGPSTDHERYVDTTNASGIAFFEKMTSLWAAMIAANKISQKEFEATVCNLHLRSVEEYETPLKNESSPVYRSGLRLISSTVHLIPCPFKNKWKREMRNGLDEATARFARSYVLSVRPWANSLFTAGLSSSRSDNEKKAIVHDFFALFEKEVMKAPEAHGLDIPVVYIHLAKRPFTLAFN